MKADRQKLNPNNSSACNAVSLEIIEGKKNLKIFILMEFGWSYFGEVLHSADSDEIRNSQPCNSKTVGVYFTAMVHHKKKGL